MDMNNISPTSKFSKYFTNYDQPQWALIFFQLGSCDLEPPRSTNHQPITKLFNLSLATSTVPINGNKQASYPYPRTLPPSSTLTFDQSP